MNWDISIKLRSFAKALCIAGLLAFFLTASYAQETTGAIQGTIKDSAGAVVSHAIIKVTTDSLPGGKTTETDGKGYYHFANLPPGAYVLTVQAKGFSELKREGISLEVGRAPSIDLTVSVGAETTVVEVSTESPQIDVTTVTSQTNITADTLDFVPRGTSFQSVIQFAPSARNEPLMGTGTSGAAAGNGSCSPGSCTSGASNGYSIGGGSDSENSYLVEGQETADLIGGYSHTNVPFEFIEEVQVKTSGIEAQHGGALGGVVDVIMKKGTQKYHGSVFSDFVTDKFNAGPNASEGYDPTSSPVQMATYLADASPEYYQSKKNHYSTVFPGAEIGGPISFGRYFHRLDDRLFFFAAFKPEMLRNETTLDYGAGNGGVIPFSQNRNTYYSTARIDAKVSERIRVFGSWLYEYQRESGENLPGADSVTGQVNTAINSAPANYAHTLGYSAPNETVNTGADITITKNLVSTTRFGYFFENYHDFGYPTGGVVTQFQDGGCVVTGGTCVAQDDIYGNPLPASLAQPIGTQSGPLSNLTAYNASKSIHLDTDLAFYKSTKFGTHNIRGGYQLNRNSNYISQIFNEPYVQVFVGNTQTYQNAGPVGAANCAALEAANTASGAISSAAGNCEGQYGYVTLYDYGTGGKATSYNNGFYIQDAWTVGHGLTLNLGVRLEHETIPGEGLLGPGVPTSPIKFGWGDKIAPRIGAAYDVFQNGKMKLFGSYGVAVDQMKLNVAISSFGGQYWQNCTYALNTSDLSSIDVAYNSSNRYCSGATSASQANFASGSTPAGLSFIENYNLRAFPTTCSTCSASQEGVAPGLKPYRQHADVFGVDYQVSNNVTLEGRYDRKRIDNVIEDSAIFNPLVGETFVIVNPGQGTNSTFEGFCNFLYGPGAGGTTNPGCVSSSGSYPPTQTIPAARSYDGVEIRATKAMSHNWTGLFSYTYSHLRGNYTGLTTSDQSDGIGRNAPNNSRAFDEPYFSYSSEGMSSSGLLPTDRPNAFKGQGYYRFNYLKKFATDLGLFQTFYAGSPQTSYANIGYSQGFPVQVVGRGTWIDVSQNPNTGFVTVGTPRLKRLPWYIQSDFNVNQTYKISEGKELTMGATFTNALNQHSVVAVNEQIDSSYPGVAQYGTPGGNPIFNGAAFYAAAESAYNLSDTFNFNNSTNTTGAAFSPETINANYGKPLLYQQPRALRLNIKFTF